MTHEQEGRRVVFTWIRTMTSAQATGNYATEQKSAIECE